MIWFHLFVVIVFIVIGARLGGIGIGLAGGAGVLVLAATGVPTYPFGTVVNGTVRADVPWSVIGIIMPVICTVAALQVAGGMDHLVYLTEKLLRKHPKQITYLAPFVTYLMAFLCGTGHTAYSVIPVIVDVAKERGIRPSRPLSIAVVASQVAVAASPISAATMVMVSNLGQRNVGYLQILAVVIPTTFIGCAVGAVVASRQGCELKDDPVYQERLAKGLVKKSTAADGAATYTPKRGAVASLIILLVALVLVVAWATISSKQLGLIAHPPIDGPGAIMIIMLTTAAVICLVAKEPAAKIAEQSTFRAGMTAAICIMGLAWLGNAFVAQYENEIKAALGGPLGAAPWLFALFLYLAAPLMFSHAATASAFMPMALTIGLTAPTMLACYPAVANYYLLPNYPTTVAAMEMDDTGSTRVGKIVFDHPFVIPGTVAIIVTVALGFLIAPIIAPGS